MLIVGFIPFFVNLCRLGAAVYQIFIFQKYNTGCLRYVFGPETNKTTINQVTYFLVPNIAEQRVSAASGRLSMLGVGRVPIFHTEFHWVDAALRLTVRHWRWKGWVFLPFFPRNFKSIEYLRAITFDFLMANPFTVVPRANTLRVNRGGRL